MTRVARAAELIGMPVVTLDTATIVGEVRDVLFDPHQSLFVGFTLRGRGFLSPAFIGLLPATEVRGIGRDAVMIPSEAVIMRERDQIGAAMGEKHDALGTAVVTDEGEEVGNISDILVEVGGDVPLVVGYCVSRVDGLEIIVPSPDGQPGWAEVVVVPSDVEEHSAEGLTGFRELLERSRAAHGGQGR